MTDRRPIDISSDDFACRLASITSSTIVTLTIETTPTGSMRKTGNPYWIKSEKRWTICKRARVNGPIGTLYGETVRKRQRKHNAKTGATSGLGWRPKRRKWGVRLPNVPFVVYCSELYVEFHQVHTYEVKYCDVETGNEVDLNTYREFLIHRRVDRSERQELPIEDQVEWRDFKLHSIRWASLWGELFHITPSRRASR